MRNGKIAVVSCAFAVLAATGRSEPVPNPVDGVVTIDISSNVTYDEPLPAASRLVKRGTGTSTLTKASSDFAPEGGDNRRRCSCDWGCGRARHV